MYKPIFEYDDNGTMVEWYWSDQIKQYHKTWKPKLNNVKIQGLTDKNESVRLQKEIWESVMLSEHPKKQKLTGIYKVRRNK